MTRRNPLAQVAVLAAALASVVLVMGAAPASAAVPCWKRLINDWYDGRIDKAYPVKCYREAIKNLPEDVEAYSSAREDINRALLAAIRSNGGGPLDPNVVIQPQRPTPAQIRGDGGRKESPLPRADEEVVASGPEESKGPFNDFLSDIGPNNVDSLPLPILVLAVIAFLLFGAAAASWVTRRIQARRVRLATSPPSRPTSR